MFITHTFEMYNSACHYNLLDINLEAEPQPTVLLPETPYSKITHILSGLFPAG